MNKMKEMVKNTIRIKMQNQNNVQTKNDAGALAISEGNVKSRLFRARKKLKKKLNNMQPEEIGLVVYTEKRKRVMKDLEQRHRLNQCFQ